MISGFDAIAPGYILTDQTAEVFAGEHGPSVLGQITMRAFGTPRHRRRSGLPRLGRGAVRDGPGAGG